MKSTLIKSVIFQSVAVAIALLASGSHATAQEAGRVAILDVAKVFKENPTFTAQMDAIKSKADKLKTDITAEQERIKAEAQKLVNFERGSAQRNAMEAKLEQEQVALGTRARQLEMQLLNEEALIYYQTYEQMQAVVEEMASQYNISLVLRFDSAPIDEKNRNEVIAGVNRTVVFHRRVDLTKMVSDALKTRMAQTGGTQLK